MKFSSQTLAIVVGLMAIVGPRSSLADVRENECEVKDGIGSCPVRLHEKHPVTLSLGSAILQTDEPDQWGVVPDVMADTIILEVSKEAKPGQIAGTYIVVTRAYTLNVIVSVANSESEASRVIRVVQASQRKANEEAVLTQARLLASKQTAALKKRQEQKMQAKDKAHAAAMKAQKAELTAEMKVQKAELTAEMKANEVKAAAKYNAELKKRDEEAEERSKRDKLRDQSKSLLDQIDGIPACAKPLVLGYTTRASEDARLTSLRILLACWDEAKAHLLVAFELENRDPRPFRFSQLEVNGRGGRVRQPQITYIETPTSDGEVIASVGMDERTRGVIAVKAQEVRSMEDLQIKLSEAEQGRWLSATITGSNAVRSIVHAYSYEEWEHELAERDAREARAKQIILGPRVSYGGCWLADAPGSSNLEATGCTMLGASLTKGITEMIAFEVDGMGGWTGETATGSAKFGRITLAGRLRFGQFTIPYARVGIGGQVASVAGSSEADLVLAIGGGVDKRLGNNVLVGLGLSWEQSTKDTTLLQRSVGIGIHLSVGWTRATEVGQ